ncbi:MAG: response regulator transcription factor [Ignavibacteriae bacterium]|nr:response regulator transcription factor [Ignavibacteriota bacterium]
MITVGIVEDDDEIREGIQRYLNSQANFECSLASYSVEDFMESLNHTEPPDVILMDIGLPGMSGIDGTKLIKGKYPEANIIMLTIYHDPDKIFESLCAGASGYLLKNTPLSQIKEAIELLYSGGAPMSPQIARKVIDYFQGLRPTKPESTLTDKEREVVVGLVDGLSYKMIADRMNVSIETIRFHIKNIYQKLHVHSKAEVITKSLRGEI